MEKGEEMKLNKIILEARKTQGIPQRELSSLLGFGTAQYISNCERDLCSYPAKHLKKFTIHQAHRLPKGLARR